MAMLVKGTKPVSLWALTNPEFLLSGGKEGQDSL